MFPRAPHHPRENKIRLISFLGFLFGFSITLLVYITSAYFQEALDSDNIGLFYVVIFSILLWAILQFDKLMALIGRGRALILLLLWQMSTLFFLSLTDVSIFGAILLVMYFVIYGVITVLWDVVLEAYSVDEDTGRVRGMFLSVFSIGLLLGPLLGTQLLERYNFHGVFTAAFILYTVIFIISLISLADLPGHRPKNHVNILSVLRQVFRTAALWRVYCLAVLLRFFYAVMTIYTPLYLRDIGFAWEQIGIMFTAMMLPFILLEYPAGVLADKKWGEKELLCVGLLIMICAVLMIIFLPQPLFWTWLAVLVFSRCGAALFESMQDSYFYKHIDGDDVALSNFYRTARPVGYILASLIASGVLLIGDIQSMYWVLVCVLCVGFIPLYALKDTQPQPQ